MKADVVFPAERLEHPEVRRRRVERAAAAEVRLGDEGAELGPVGVPEGVEFPAVRGRVERVVPLAHVPALLPGEADEVNPRVALRVGLRPGDGAGQALLAVEAVAGGQHQRPVAGHAGPQGFLHRLGPGRRPQHLLQPPAAGRPLAGVQQQPARLHLHRGDGVVGGQRHRLAVPAHQFLHPAQPAGRVVPEVGDQHPAGEVEQPPAVGRPVEHAGAAGEDGLGRGEGAEGPRLGGGDAVAVGVGGGFARVGDGVHAEPLGDGLWPAI